MTNLENPILTEVDSLGVARLTLNRPKALNALSLEMIRQIAAALKAWQQDADVRQVLLRGMGKQGAFGAFCAGGDIRYFYEAVHAEPGVALNRASLEAFFTEEYRLNHLIHRYGKPIWALMDGVVMGGGMGISQGARLRVVTERTKMAMPETAIGLFPDVGGGYFLSRCADANLGVGEYLALTGCLLNGADAVQLGLADIWVDSQHLPDIWGHPQTYDAQALAALAPKEIAHSSTLPPLADVQKHFNLATVPDIMASLRSDHSDWAQAALQKLEKNSPLMLAVSLEQIRRARHMSLADDLRMERDMVYHCFAGTPERHSDTVEGIRALVIDKDHHPRWQPERAELVSQQAVDAFFASPWTDAEHPLATL
jgi:enoyl-CoA hydratase/carnithine racemase